MHTRDGREWFLSWWGAGWWGPRWVRSEVPPVPTAVAAMLIGNFSLYIVGLPWLVNFVGWGAVVRVGLLPFIIGDLVKIVLAALALPCGWALAGARHDV